MYRTSFSLLGAKSGNDIVIMIAPRDMQAEKDLNAVVENAKT